MGDLVSRETVRCVGGKVKHQQRLNLRGNNRTEKQSIFSWMAMLFSRAVLFKANPRPNSFIFSSGMTTFLKQKAKVN